MQFAIFLQLIKKIRSNLLLYLGPIVLALCIILGFMILYLSNRMGLNQEDIAISILLSCFLYIILKRRLNNPLSSEERKVFRFEFIFLNFLYAILLLVSLYLLKNSLYFRPFWYFIIVSLAAGIIALESLNLKELEHTKKYIILLQVLFLSLSISGGIYYLFPGFIGTDIWEHSNFALVISTLGNIPPRSIFDIGQYNFYPIMHLVIAITGMITHLDIKESVFIAILLNGVINTIFIYIVANHCLGYKQGLIAMLLFNISDGFILLRATAITPASLCMCYLCTILCLIFCFDRRASISLLIICFMPLIVLTHQLSTFVILVIIIGIMTGLIIFSGFSFNTISKKPHSYIGVAAILLYVVLISTYWVFTDPSSNSLVKKMTKITLKVLTSFDFIIDPVESPYVQALQNYNLFSTATFHLGYLILLIFAIIGLFIWFFSMSIDNFKISVIFSLIFMYFFVYIIPLSGFKDAMLSHRWLPFIYLFLIFLASQGILNVISLIKSSLISRLFTLIIIFIFVFSMITTPYINKDNPIFDKDRTLRTMFKDSELNGAESISLIYDKVIVTDTVYLNAFKKTDFKGMVEKLNDNPIDIEINGKMIILRKSSLFEPIQVSQIGRFSHSRLEIIGKKLFDYFGTNNNGKIYDNGEIYSFIGG